MKNNIVPFTRALSSYEEKLEYEWELLESIEEQEDNILFAQEGCLILLAWGYLLPIRLKELELEEIIEVSSNYTRLVAGYIRSWRIAQERIIGYRADLLFLDLEWEV